MDVTNCLNDSVRAVWRTFIAPAILLLDRYVAIKVLRDDKSRNADFDQQFQLEARAAANLSHPNIVTVYDFGIDNGQPFIVMELVPGTDLKSLLRKRGRFTVEDGIPLMVQACAGLGYAHRAGLVHCDVKPHNMLVTPDNRLKVTDFGIARVLATISPNEHNGRGVGVAAILFAGTSGGTCAQPGIGRLFAGGRDL